MCVQKIVREWIRDTMTARPTQYRRRPAESGIRGPLKQCSSVHIMYFHVLQRIGLLWSLCVVSLSIPSTAFDQVPAHSIGDLEEETGFYQAIEVTEDSPIYRKKSKFQDIRVYKSHYYGKILMLDGVLQLTERDADSYNEMMAHMAMFRHKNPKRALVIGGGDGYVLSEVLKHDSIEHVDHVDLDDGVIEACKEHFSWGKAWSDPRVTLHVADGAAFVQQAPSSSYDVIIQDSSDPWTTDDEGNYQTLPSSILYTKQHFVDVFRILTPAGVFNFQAETFNIPTDLEGIHEWWKQAQTVGFEQARYGSLYISSYTTGQIGFMLCEKNSSEATSMEQVEKRFENMEAKGLGTTYYQPKLQESAFDLPLWVESAINEGTAGMRKQAFHGGSEEL